MIRYLPEIKNSPVIEKIKAPCPAEELFLHFSEIQDASLLNSSMSTDAGRYSFIGIEPFLSIKNRHDHLELKFNGHNLTVKDNPLECLDSIIKTYKTDNTTSLPFISGGIGYLSYDLKDILEDLPRDAIDDLGLPDLYFVFYQALIIYDNLDPEHLYISALALRSDEYKKPAELIKEIKNIIGSSVGHLSSVSKGNSYDLESNFSKPEYINAVKKVIDYIKAGDIYQACLSQRFKTTWDLPAYALYQKLNKINPAPFSAYLNFDEAKIISSSPELFLRVQDSEIETRPMKGTRPRGKTEEEDSTFKLDLENSRKDNSELSMIVDLERNDLGKISVPGSVNVSEHRRIEKYPTVFQTISVIKSKLDKDTSLVDIIKATFPGGSISGCPKIRAMEIIDELEPTRRGIYTGSIGYISFHNTMNLNVAIRTMILKDKDVYFQAGGGIVAASDPEAEYQETLTKAQALITSLN